MIAVVSRVAGARVVVDGETVGEIHGEGLLVLLGVANGDDDEVVRTMGRKVTSLRLLRDDASVLEKSAPVLVVSQFTLLGNTRKGRRPSWSAAAPPKEARARYEQVIEDIRGRGVLVATGRFGADMSVESLNDGPYTVLVHA
ncbi:D-tyrosyl-tRNA(Tyr) deacylase [Hoyosella sp. G463]|uniref:D-aminoacyl-tRNA deacylase n=1 Tax=Lolliginicoccus lacisalsi TaxID=2742202 RepID=A0A927JA48_9ACTN|nr:D-aminoacyl-tRNA deacylase [Lolliginicoccus lacisalsi]MBD8505378.1 D-tyrosyl-tRNA(Tyr) deacylase [Lolliginicoccus lacisalsi]